MALNVLFQGGGESTATCREQEKLWVNIILLIIQDGCVLYICFISCSAFYFAVLKEYEIITLKYNGNAGRSDLLCFWAPEEKIL